MARDLYQQYAELMRVLANPARLVILDRLGKGECTASELVSLVGCDPSTVSKHMALLKAYRLVEDRRERNQVFYRLATPCVLNFLSCARQTISEMQR